MLDAKENINLLGAIVANVNNIILTLLFIARIYKYPKAEYLLGILFMLSIFPLLFMLVNSLGTKKEFLYFLQLILMIGFIVIEFLLDYLLKIDFRQNRNYIIPYITLFYASLGGMIGIGSHGGKHWTAITIITFLLVVAASLTMHFKTNT